MTKDEITIKNFIKEARKEIIKFTKFLTAKDSDTVNNASRRIKYHEANIAR